MPKIHKTRRVTTTCAALFVGLAATTAGAAVSVDRGPTPIEGGEAQADGDITLRNDNLVVSIAAESAGPWGVASGGIVDAAPIIDGEVQRDMLSLVDLIPNNWSSWPSSYQRVEIVKDTPELAKIRVERDWAKVEMVSTYTLASGSNSIHLTTTMTNTGDKPLKNLLSGYVAWPNGGNIFGMPGLTDQEEAPADDGLTDWSAFYAEDWAVVLHAPYTEYIDYGGRDLYLRHTLKPGETQSFEAWVQVLPSGNLAPAITATIQREDLPAGSISGDVTTSNGAPVEDPVVVIKQDGQPYAFTTGDDGHYKLQLPAGEYSLYATAAHYAHGDPVQITVAAGEHITQDFTQLAAPGKVHFVVSEAASGKPLDARITVEKGQTPLVAFLGQKTYFTELKPIGELTVPIAPGKYVFQVGHGDEFLARPAQVKVTVETGETATVPVSIEQLTFPNKAGWYSADMHHHSDVLDGFTSPEFVLRSQLAVGLDLALLSDHDTSRNLKEMAKLAASRDVPFIPAMEISPSWGHFITYPIDLDAELTVNPATAPVSKILNQEQALGGMAIQANHPYIKYGYYHSLKAGTVTGEYDAGYDLIEINASVSNNAKTWQKARDHWTHGEHYYLSAGSDVHDVWKHRSGEARAYVHLFAQPTAERFVAALRTGHAFVSFGPLVFPDVMFGRTLEVTPDTAVDLGFKLASANGLKRVTLYSENGVVTQKTFDDAPVHTRVQFQPTPVDDSTWYALVVEDTQGNKAYTNPIWVDVTQFRPLAAK